MAIEFTAGMTAQQELVYIKARYAELGEAHQKRSKDLLDAIRLVMVLRSALDDLVTVQNGPPLYTLTEGWNAAMEAASQADAKAGVWLAKFGYNRPFSAEEVK